jgi:hypothetical protein
MTFRKVEHDAGAEQGDESTTLVGLFFVVEGDEGWQGFVERTVGPSHYLVRLLVTAELTNLLPGAWVMENPIECKVISIDDAARRNWSWFTSREAWVEFRRNGLKADAQRSALAAFVSDRCVLGPGASVECEALFDAWAAWAKEHGRQAVGTVQVFGRDLSAQFPELKITQPRVEGGRERHYNGIALR